MTSTILVTGATGMIGRATIAALRTSGAQPIAFVRDPERAARALGSDTPLRFGDLTKAWTLTAALDGVDAVLLCSGHDPAMAQMQLSAARAITASDARRVVKISGSPVSVAPDSPSRTGREHWEIEDELRATAGGREVVAVRPNAFMQNFFDQAPAIAHGALPGPDGLPCVSFADARDIGRVAAAALLAEQAPDAVLEVTGPEKLTLFDVARALSTALGRLIVHQPLQEDVMRQGLLAMGRPEWLVDHMLELAALMREPKAAEVTDTVQRVTGRAPMTLTEFLTENAAAFPAAA